MRTKVSDIERVPSAEKDCGVSLVNCMAYYEGDDVDEYNLTARIELNAIERDRLGTDVEVHVLAYNIEGQLCGEGDDHVDCEEFFALDTVEVEVECMEPPAKIKIFPRKYE